MEGVCNYSLQATFRGYFHYRTYASLPAYFNYLIGSCYSKMLDVITFKSG